MSFKEFRNSVYSKFCIFFYYSSSLPQKLVYHKCSSSTDCKNQHFFQGASTYHIPFSCTVKKQTITYRAGCALIQLFLLVSCSNANKVTWQGGLNVGKESPISSSTSANILKRVYCTVVSGVGHHICLFTERNHEVTFLVYNLFSFLLFHGGLFCIKEKKV